MQLLADLDALLITNPTNIRYLTGFVGVAENEREAYVLITESKTYLFTNSLYLEQAKSLTSEVIEVSREKPLAKELKRLAAKLGIKKLGFEEENLTVSGFQKLKKELKDIILVPSKNRIEEFRMIKRPDEIENIKKASQLTDEGFDFILGKIKPGVAESEIAWEIESFLKSRGAGVAFSPIVAFGKNSSQPHYSTNEKLKMKNVKLNTQDVALLDFGARVNGYCSDMTRIVLIGKPKPEWKKAYQAVLDAQQAVLQKILHILIYEENTPVSGAKLDRLAKSIIKKSGFKPYSHSLGHNIGLDIHEMPRLTAKKDAILRPGTVFSVEPGIYKEGQYGIRLEDLVLLKKTGLEILTKSTKELITL